MALYHFKLGFPKGVEQACKNGRIALSYSFHARKAARDDRYGRIKLPSSIDTDRAKLIEVEIKDDKLTKAVYRVAYSSDCDLVLVVNPDRSVRTVWLNKIEDSHKTLNKSRYRIPA